MELCQERRGDAPGHALPVAERVQITYDLPLAEIVLDFFDQLKTRTRGYASLDYEPIGLRPSNLVKLDVLLGGDPVDALSMVVHRDKAYDQGKVLTERLRKKIPRQQYDVPIQAAVGAKIIARETVKAFRKDVTAKCYGGDITPQAQAAGEAEGGQAADEAGRPDRGAAGGVPGRARARGRRDDERDLRGRAREGARVRVRGGGDRPALPRSRGGARGRLRRRRRAADVRRRVRRPGRVPGDHGVGLDFTRMVHGAQEFTWHEPVVAGDEITTEAELDETSERGGLQFYVFKSTSKNQRGELVSEGRWTNIVR